MSPVHSVCVAVSTLFGPCPLGDKCPSPSSLRPSRSPLVTIPPQGALTLPPGWHVQGSCWLPATGLDLKGEELLIVAGGLWHTPNLGGLVWVLHGPRQEPGLSDLLAVNSL